ncbi:MAG TPA: VanZ family protein [Thermoanaerobaculia bacterium]|nr:VanZ family protein [Thermoanaerobaculia bacterium]
MSFVGSVLGRRGPALEWQRHLRREATLPRMDRVGRSRLLRALPPIAVTLAIFALAPAGSYVTSWARSMPSVAIPLLSAAFLLAATGFLIWAVRRMRFQLARRLPWVLTAIGLVALQQLLSERGTALERTVERMHFLLFGALAAATFLALRPPSRRADESPPGGRATAGLTLVVVAWVAVLDELLQDLLMARTGDAFDVGLNLFSGLIGVIASAGLFPMRWSGAAPRRRWRTALWLLVPLPLLLALFLESAHLGSRIEAKGLGVFHSFYSSAAALERANRDRQRRWQRRLPPQPPFEWWVLQDDFLVEGGWHVHARNLALEQGDLETVWIENTIVERFYSAMLDAPFPEDRHPYRLKSWDLERLNAAGIGAGALPRAQDVEGGRVISRADRGRIWVSPSRAQTWSSAIVLSLVAGFFARSRRAGTSGERASAAAAAGSRAARR